MLRPLPSFRSVISLIPNSGIQFLDFGFDIDRTPKLTRSFWEERRPVPPGAATDAETGPTVVVGGADTAPADGDSAAPPLERVLLRNLRLHPAENVLYDPATDTVPADDDPFLYHLNKAKGLEVFLEKWVPIPLFRVRSEPAPGVWDLDHGPSNWARVLVTALDEPDRDGNTHRVVIAVDTELRGLDEGRPYLVASPRDSEEQSKFAFTWDEQQVAWFLGEPWVDDWLDELFREFKAAQRPGRPLRPEDMPYACEHWARYLTFLQAVGEACRPPAIRLIDAVSREPSHQPIPTDLVLDIGNSRTCGILIESNPDERLDLNDAYALELRDLSRPHQGYADAFESQVEFVQASFGKDAISRRSGRSKAFHWPSAVRVGPEAARLAGEVLGTEGITGLSSPKRYLWDRRPVNQVWRFNGAESRVGQQEPPVSGPIMAFVNEEGEVLRHRGGRGTAAVRAKFSRSSLFTFMVAEIIVQAIAMVNAPSVRGRRRYADVPRRLRRIILTLPPAIPLAEQRVMRDRVHAAIKLVWDAFGWSQADGAVPPEPQVTMQWDEASATHLVWLYTEITQKLHGAAKDLFEILGKPRDGYGDQPTLRLASIDIGGGTTDLMVTTYRLEGNRAIDPHQDFREGFKIAGDDIVEAVIERHVLPALEQALGAAGIADGKAVMRRLFSNRGGMSEQERHLRKQFVAEVCVPIALAMLHAHETARPFAEEAPYDRAFADFFAAETRPSDRVLDYLRAAVREEGVADFDLDAVLFDISMDALSRTVRLVMGEILADLSEVIHALDCDVLLLSGRPSRLPAVTDGILAHMPVRPDRLIAMHMYRVGNWYPFRDTNGRIDDPKTTAAVGGMLCALAEGQIEGFLLRSSLLGMRSTARYVGEMEISGQILDERVLFADIDLEAAEAPAGDAAARLKFWSPTFLGFRQLGTERWPATPLYFLDFADPARAARMALPLQITIERPDLDDEAPEELKEDFRITEIEEADGTAKRPGDVSMRLQTLKVEAGYWLDTGVLTVF